MTIRALFACVLAFDSLVASAFAQTRFWIGKGDGVRWSNAANWSNGRVPGPTDDAVILENFTGVVYEAGDTTIRNLEAPGGLRIREGTLTITAGACRVGGTFVVEAGGGLVGSGSTVRFFMDGDPVTWDGYVQATGGAILDLSKVVQVGGRNPRWSAVGNGSVIDASALKSLNLTSDGWFPVEASFHGRIYLTGLTSITGPLRPTATSSGLVDLSSAAGQWTQGSFTYAPIVTLSEGGQIPCGITSWDSVTVDADALGGLNPARWTSFTRGTLQVHRSLFELTSLTLLDDSSVQADSGAAVRLPALRGVHGRNPNWRASGNGSMIDASAVTEISVDPDGWFPLTADNQGRIYLSGLTEIGGPLRPSSTDGGLIDLSGARGRWSKGNHIYDPIVTARDGGQIVAPGLFEFDSVTVNLDAANGLATGQWTAFNGGALRLARTTYVLEQLSSLDGAKLEASEGAVVRLPALRAIRGHNPVWIASNAGTVIDASGVTTVELDKDGWFPIGVDTKARIDLSGVTELHGPLRPTAISGGTIDLSGARGRWGNAGFLYQPILTAATSGQIQVPGITALEAATVDLDATGSVPSAQWESFTGGTLRLNRTAIDLGRIANLDDTTLRLSRGATVHFKALRRIGGRNPDWEAKDAGTLIDAASVLAIQLAKDGWFPVRATDGARIDLSGVRLSPGPVRATALNDGSIDLRGLLGTWSSTGFIYDQILSASGGGKILCPDLLRFERGRIEVQDGGIVDLRGLQELINSAVVVDGASAVLPLGSLQNTGGSTLEEKNGGRVVLGNGPRIVGQPAGQRVDLGAAVTLEVAATGDAPLSYQWFKNGQALPGANAATLQIASLALADAGAYSVIVANAAGTAQSDPAVIRPILTDLPFADAFADRGRITTASGLGTVENTAATLEPNEPRHAAKRGGHSVWVTWKAPGSGVVTMGTAGSSFDTILSVYLGNSVSNLVEVVADEDSGGYLTSRVRFNATRDAEYQIALDGFNGATGTAIFAWNLDAQLQAVPEITRQPVGTLAVPGQFVLLFVTTPTTNVGFQWFRGGQAIPGANSSTLIFPSFKPEQAGSYFVRLSTPAGVFLDSVPATLEGADRRQTASTLSADKRADLFPDNSDLPDTGAAFASQLALASRPRRVGLASAPPPSVGLPGSQWTDNSDSTRSPDDPGVCNLTTTASRWFRLRFAVSTTAASPVKITTAGSDIATMLAVFTNNLAPKLIACDVAVPTNHPNAEVQIQVQRGVDYLVLVDGIDGARGRIKLNWDGQEEAPSTYGVVDGRFRVEMRIVPGKYDWDRADALGTWTNLLRTNITSGVFRYGDTNPITSSAGFFRLKPVQ